MITVELVHYKDENEDCVEYFDTYEKASEYVDYMSKNSSCYFMYAIIENKKTLRLFCDTEMNKYRNDVSKLINEYTKNML